MNLLDRFKNTFFGLKKVEKMVNLIALKVKIKTLMKEARVIRHEEQKLHGMDKWKLQHHRKTKVRDAARRSQVAYQILRKRDWKSCAKLDENGEICYQDRKEVTRMIRKYGNEAGASLPPVDCQTLVKNLRLAD